MPVKDLYEYRKMKKERRGFKLHLVLVGLVFLAAAAVFQYLFYVNT
jgi:Tfp pilus assembly protein PilN